MKLLPTFDLFGLILRINLFLTRQIASGVILFLSIVCFLLPASVVTYLSFHKLLIPLNRIQVPVNFLDLVDRPLKLREIDTTEVLPFLEQNRNLTFTIRLNLHGICKVETTHQVFSYSLELPTATNTVYEDRVLVNCDSRYIYASKNRLIPYNLRYWAPPILVNVAKLVDMDHEVLTMRAYELLEALNQGKPVIRLEQMNFLFLDPNRSSVDFDVLWEGFRFYLVHYYLTSFLIGTLLFWVPASTTCFLFALMVLVYLKPREENHPVKQESTSVIAVKKEFET